MTATGSIASRPSSPRTPISLSHSTNGPEGLASIPNFCGNANGGAAIYRVGNQVGFVISGSVVTANAAGTLEVGICDCPGCYGDNLGPGFTFTVICNATPTGCNIIT